MAMKGQIKVKVVSPQDTVKTFSLIPKTCNDRINYNSLPDDKDTFKPSDSVPGPLVCADMGSACTVEVIQYNLH